MSEDKVSKKIFLHPQNIFGYFSKYSANILNLWLGLMQFQNDDWIRPYVIFEQNNLFFIFQLFCPSLHSNYLNPWCNRT